MINYAILININSPFVNNNNIHEMYGLAESAGYVILDEITQRMGKPDPQFFMGAGKVAQVQKALFEHFNQGLKTEQAKVLMEEYDETTKRLMINLTDDIQRADQVTAIFNNTLRTGQKIELSKRWAIDVLDRNDIILEIFEEHAKTRQSKLQIELARMKLMADIVKTEFGRKVQEKQGRDFRGKGRMGWEPKVRAYRETRRKITEELKKISKDRSIRRKRRSKLFNIGIVGYTNAGKSTLLNAITSSEVETANEEFTTVNTTSRRFTIPKFDKYGNWEGEKVIVTDSVGFVENMSPVVLEAFLSTLEELKFSDMIILVADISEPDFEDIRNKLTTTFSVLGKIGADKLPKLLILNKTDKISEQEKVEREQKVKHYFPDVPTTCVSALKTTGIEELKDKIISYKKKYHDVYTPEPEWKKYVTE